ncbi:hypothetical protein CPter291_0483 [Collimonas pratensis]|uniref:Uncharacterized protein n=1 Tax=Collimonas pratensis TaxID=279113 RepID=A0ABN4M994_9BURK|nr:hypothetical protein CPter291_0483 [Collimonas pratensis]
MENYNKNNQYEMLNAAVDDIQVNHFIGLRTVGAFIFLLRQSNTALLIYREKLHEHDIVAPNS